MTATDTRPTVTDPAAGDVVARVEDLHVTFPTDTGDVHAVRGVSFEDRRGEVLAIVGESGSGKSVTARALVGLAGHRAALRAARLEVAGEDVRHLSERRWQSLRGRRVGLVLQDALVSLDPLRTVGREVGEVLRAHRLAARRDIPGRVVESLTAVGIPDAEVRARQHPHELSGGLRQRALIASALTAAPDLLVADEPTTALDVTVQAQVLQVLATRREAGTALLLISHDLAVVSSIADRVLVMRHGEVVEAGPTRELLRAPQHPYTRRLVAAVPSASSRGRRLSITEHDDGGALDRAPLPTRRVDTGTELLRAGHVTKHFPLPGGGRRTAVDDVSVHLHRGETLGIVGESGSGKSTLARILLGLLPADSGTVTARPAPAAEGGSAARRRLDLQLVAQDPLGSFDPRYTVGEVVAEPLRTLRVPRAARARRVTELLDQVGLPGTAAARHPRELSGGQRQRVAIARALAPEPSVLVADEPVSALDVSVQAQVLDLLAELQAELGTSLVLISHDLGVVHHLADRVAVMRAGRVVEDGDVDRVFHDPQHPYTAALLAALPDLVVNR